MRNYLKLLIAVLIASVFSTGIVKAQQNNQILAVLCDSTGPSITINQPQSDSVVTTPTIAVEGQAERTSQLDFYINNVYNSSLALTTDPHFQTTIPLSVGTNTIRIDAYFSCNNTNSTTSLVLDYQPIITTPSTPETTDTSIPGSIGRLIKKIIGDSSENTGQSVVERVKDNLNLGNNETEASSDNSFVKSAYSWTLLIAVIALLVLLVSSSAIISSIGSFVGISKLRVKRHKFITRLFIFTLIILIALMLVQ